MPAEKNNSHGTDLSLEDYEHRVPHLISRQAQNGEEGCHNPLYTEESKRSKRGKIYQNSSGSLENQLTWNPFPPDFLVCNPVQNHPMHSRAGEEMGRDIPDAST